MLSYGARISNILARFSLRERPSVQWAQEKVVQNEKVRSNKEIKISTYLFLLLFFRNSFLQSFSLEEER